MRLSRISPTSFERADSTFVLSSTSAVEGSEGVKGPLRLVSGPPMELETEVTTVKEK